MHEMAHTRQFPQLMPLLDRLQKRYRMPERIDDDLIQTTFSGDAAFRKLYEEALGHLRAATVATDDGAAGGAGGAGLVTDGGGVGACDGCVVAELGCVAVSVD